MLTLTAAYEAGVKLALAQAGLLKSMQSLPKLKLQKPTNPPPAPGLNPSMSNFGNTPLRMPTDAGPVAGSSPLPFSLPSGAGGDPKSGVSSGTSSGVAQSGASQ